MKSKVFAVVSLLVAVLLVVACQAATPAPVMPASQVETLPKGVIIWDYQKSDTFGYVQNGDALQFQAAYDIEKTKPVDNAFSVVVVLSSDQPFNYSGFESEGNKLTLYGYKLGVFAEGKVVSAEPVEIKYTITGPGDIAAVVSIADKYGRY